MAILGLIFSSFMIFLFTWGTIDTLKKRKAGVDDSVYPPPVTISAAILSLMGFIFCLLYALGYSFGNKETAPIIYDVITVKDGFSIKGPDSRNVLKPKSNEDTIIFEEITVEEGFSVKADSVIIWN